MMDVSSSIGGIGGLSWNPGITPLKTPEGQGRPVSGEAHASPPPLGDSLDIQFSAPDIAPPGAQLRLSDGAGDSGGFHQLQGTGFAAATVTGLVAQSLQADSAPVNLLAEEGPGQASEAKPFNWLQALGNMQGVQAVDDRPQVSEFKDLSLIGPSNAAQYLGHPEGLYMGL
jgi:hypothetical protein